MYNHIICIMPVYGNKYYLGIMKYITIFYYEAEKYTRYSLLRELYIED